MARLRDLSVLDTERGQAALAVLLETSPYVRFLEENSGFEEQGTDFVYSIIDGVATLQRRSVGGEYTPDDKTPPGKTNGSLAFVGDSVDIDISHVEDDRRGLLDIDRWIDKELRKTVRTWAKLYEKELFQGSGAGSPRQVTGLQALLDGTDVPGFTGYTAVEDAADYTAAADTSFDLSDEANWDAFIEAFQQWIMMVDDPTGIIANKQLYARLATIARRKHILGESRDLFGRPQRTFDGVPLVPVRNEVITTSEPDNAGTPNNNTTSLYIQHPGEGMFSVVTNSGLHFDDVGRLEKKESDRVKWEIRSDNTVQEKDVILRVRNIKL